MHGIAFEPKEKTTIVEEVPIKYEYENNLVIPLNEMAGTQIKCNFSKNGLNISCNDEMDVANQT